MPLPLTSGAQASQSDESPSPRKTLISDQSRPAWNRNKWPWLAAVLLLVLAAATAFGYSKYHATESQLSDLVHQHEKRTAAAKLASAYAVKSLTYSYQDPDAFFRAVEDDVAQQLKEKYANATALLKAVMLQAQATSSGEVLSTEVQELPGDIYQVVVTASQTMRNLQNPETRRSTLVLQLTIIHDDHHWQVADIGPKAHDSNSSAVPTSPSPAAPSPASAPAAAQR